MKPSMREILLQGRNFLVLAVVTLLIWLLAEAESLRVEKARADLVFRADPETGRFIRVDPEFSGAVTVRLEGSTARVDELATKLRRPLRLEPGMEGIPLEQGRHSVDLRTVLRDLPMVRESGASVAEVDPAMVAVTVGNLVNIDAKVRVELPPGLALESPAEVSPPSVRIRMTEADATKLPQDFQVVASIPSNSIASLPEGRRATLRDIRLELPEPIRGAESVRISPAAVDLTLTLRSRTDAFIIPSVPVHVRLAPTETGIWDISMPAESRILNDVTVRGPTQDVDAIRTGKLKPIAYVPLSFEELEAAAASTEPVAKEPIFCDLPTQLLFELRPQQKSVRLVVKRRAQPSGIAPGVVTPGTVPPATPGNGSPSGGRE